MIRLNQFSWKRNRQAQLNPAENLRDCPRRKYQLTLADAEPGLKVRMVGFCPGINADRRAQLTAYGVSPGHFLQVIQHKPVTVVSIEHTELAMEIELACEILVEIQGQELLN
jgi:Fe2+ transport system protein FeoA